MGHTAVGPGTGLLLPGHAAKVFLGDGQQAFKLAHPLVADVARLLSCTGVLKEPHCFLVVGFRHVKGVLEGGFVLKCRFVVHGTSVVPIPG